MTLRTLLFAMFIAFAIPASAAFAQPGVLATGSGCYWTWQGWKLVYVCPEPEPPPPPPDSGETGGQVPELDANVGMSALALIGGAALLMTTRRRRKHAV